MADNREMIIDLDNSAERDGVKGYLHVELEDCRRFHVFDYTARHQAEPDRQHNPAMVYRRHPPT